MNKALLLLSAIVLGACAPWLGSLSFLFRYVLLGMLWISFLELKQLKLERLHLYILGLNVLVAVLGFALLRPFSKELALLAFVTGIAPTAVSAPAVVGAMQGRIEFAVSSVFVTNLSVCVTLPAFCWLVLDSKASLPVGHMAADTVLTVLGPLAAAWLVKRFAPKARLAILKWKGINLIAWTVLVAIAVGRSTQFIRSQNIPVGHLVCIACISLAVCVVSFAIGGALGRRAGLELEASQSLGQKNNSLAVWLALTYLSPTIALGPVFYVVFHNLYNSYQFRQFSRRVPGTVAES